MSPSGVLANDHDPEGRPLTALVQQLPQHGTLTLHSNGAFQYVPDPNYYGPDEFSYVASDGIVQSSLVLGLQETGYVNPLQDAGGKYGHGFEDVLIDDLGNLFIVEYKGGDGAINGI